MDISDFNAIHRQLVEEKLISKSSNFMEVCIVVLMMFKMFVRSCIDVPFKSSFVVLTTRFNFVCDQLRDI